MKDGNGSGFPASKGVSNDATAAIPKDLKSGQESAGLTPTYCVVRAPIATPQLGLKFAIIVAGCNYFGRQAHYNDSSWIFATPPLLP